MAFRLSSLALRLTSIVFGATGVFCLYFSFYSPDMGLYAILNLGAAFAINLTAPE